MRWIGCFATPLVLLICFLSGTYDLAAESIPLWGTGLDMQGQLLSPGMNDPHYTIVEAPSGYSTPIVPKGTSNNPTEWAANTQTSQWINPTGNGMEFLKVGYYAYQTTFDLSGLDPSTARIEGNWATDNFGEVYLNGQSTGIALEVDIWGSMNPLHAFSIASGFQVGVNSLTFRVLNIPAQVITDNPTGVQVQITSATAAPIPEPSTLVLLGMGAITLLAYAWRRRRS